MSLTSPSEYLNIGSTPPDEACAQLGHPDYQRVSRIECEVYALQLRRELREKFSVPETTGLPVRLAVKVFPHDFGSYREVVCYYNPSDERSTEMAFYCESEASSTWDAISREELRRRLASIGEGE